jgi:hypothetical protein
MQRATSALITLNCGCKGNHSCYDILAQNIISTDKNQSQQTKGKPLETQLNLHRPAPVPCKVEGRLHFVQPIAARQKRFHLDGPPVDEVDGNTELFRGRV